MNANKERDNAYVVEWFLHDVEKYWSNTENSQQGHGGGWKIWHHLQILLLPELAAYINNTTGMKQELFALREHLSSLPVLFCGDRVAHRFSFFVLSYNVSLHSEFRSVMSVTISSLPPVVCGRAYVLFTLFVFDCVYM